MSKKQTHSVTRYSFVGENKSLLDQYEQLQTNANPKAISTGSICKNSCVSVGQNRWLFGTRGDVFVTLQSSRKVRKSAQRVAVFLVFARVF